MFRVKCRGNDTATAESSWNDSDVSSLDKDESSDDEAQLDEFSSTEALHRTILSERAAMLMQRESSVIYSSDAYFTNDIVSEDMSKLSLGSLSPDVQDELLIESSTIDPIDLNCRSKMIEWSIKVVEFSYPPPSYPSSFSGRKRKHSLECLRIVTAAFSYVDRVMARPLDQPSHNKTVLQIQTRRQYKLLCMISLHLAAKMSGLFSRGDHDYLEMLRSESNKSEKCMKVSASESSICTAKTTCSSVNSEAEASLKSADIHSSQVPNEEILSQTHQPRPLLHLVSYRGLYTLCQGEFSIEEMFQMEQSILYALDWRLNGGLVLEWLCLILECCAYGKSYRCIDLEHVNLEEVKESALIQLEGVIETLKPITVRPSMLALAACTTAAHTCMPRTVPDSELELLALSLIRVLGLTIGAEEFENAVSALKSEMNFAYML